MVELLGQEQADDDNKKIMCNTELDRNGEVQAETEQSLKAMGADEENVEDQVGTTKEDLANLKKSIAETDASVQEATAQRKGENAAFVEELASNNAAVELIEMAKNKLHKYYDPAIHKEATTPEPT